MDELAGQLSSPLAGGGLALSNAKPIEEGARAALLLAPGLFRLDVCPREDTLKHPGAQPLRRRVLAGATAASRTSCSPFDGPAISAHALRIEVDGRSARVLISATRDTERGRMQFVAQAILGARPSG